MSTPVASRFSPLAFGKVAVFMGGRAELGAVERLVRVGALGRPSDAVWTGGGV
jgi:hypothetical protein